MLTIIKHRTPILRGPLAEGLVGAWLFTEGAGTRVQDHSGYNNHGVLTGTTAWQPGPYGPEYLFASGKYVSIGTTRSYLNFDRLDRFSLVCFVRPNLTRSGAAAYTSIPISKLDSASPNKGYEISFGWDGTSKTLFQFTMVNNVTTNYLGVRSTVDMPNDVLAVMGMSYDGSSAAAGVSLYTNGVPETETVLNDTLSASIVNAAIGVFLWCRNTTFSHAGSGIAQLAYKRILTPREHMDLARGALNGWFERPNSNLIVPPGAGGGGGSTVLASSGFFGA